MEEPQFQFTGIWIPAELVLQVEEGRISAAEAYFLGIVHGLTKARGVGCWAYNRHLAKKNGVQTRRIRGIIAHLEKLEMLEVTNDGGRRLLTLGQGVSEMTWGRSKMTSGEVRNDRGRGVPKGTPLDIKIETTSPHLVNGGSSVAVFDKKKDKPHKASDFDLACAHRLYTLATEKRKRYIIGTPAKKWAEDFRLLRKVVGEARIKSALDWYDAHCTEKDMPRIDSGKDFRRHFNWLEDLATKNPTVEIGEDCRAICKRLRMLHWPKGSDEHLEIVVQLSIDRLWELSRRRTQIQQDMNGKRDRYFRFVEWLGMGKLQYSNHFIETWMEAAHRRVSGWEDWNGDLLAFTFSVDAKQFKRMGKEWASEYANDPALWSRFMEDVAK